MSWRTIIWLNHSKQLSVFHDMSYVSDNKMPSYMMWNMLTPSMYLLFNNKQPTITESQALCWAPSCRWPCFAFRSPKKKTVLQDVETEAQSTMQCVRVTRTVQSSVTQFLFIQKYISGHCIFSVCMWWEHLRLNLLATFKYYDTLWLATVTIVCINRSQVPSNK